MGAVVEVHLVTHIEPQADRAKMTLQAAARIKDAAHIIAAQSIHGAEERSDSGRGIAELEVDEPALEGDERLNGVMADVNLRTKFAVQYAQVRPLNRDRAGSGVRKAFVESLIEVVGHLPFKLQPLVGLKAGAGTHAA